MIGLWYVIQQLICVGLASGMGDGNLYELLSSASELRVHSVLDYGPPHLVGINREAVKGKKQLLYFYG